MNTDFLTSQQLILLEFVKEKHGTQVRKGNGEPYWYHLVRVAKTCYDELDYWIPLGMIEAALCHDLLEDTECTLSDLSITLGNFDYIHPVNTIILQGVWDLTDEYTAKDYPGFNRRKRKELEAKRLSEISFFSQTIKYADILDNAASMGYDPGFEKVWLREAREIMRGMDKGDLKLYQRVLNAIYKNTNRE